MAGNSKSGGSRKVGVDGTEHDGTPDRPRNRGPMFDSIWNEVLEVLDSNILRRADIFQLEILCTLILEVRELNEFIRLDPSDTRTRNSRLKAMAHIHRLSVSFGMTPLDRARLNAPPSIPSGELNPFSELMARLVDATS